MHWNDQLKSHLFLQIHVLLLFLISLIDCCLEMCCFENCCLPLNNKLIDRYIFPCLSFIYINLVGGIRWSTTRNLLSIIERILKDTLGTGVFLWILRHFWEHLFYRTPPDYSFCKVWELLTLLKIWHEILKVSKNCKFTLLIIFFT